MALHGFYGEPKTSRRGEVWDSLLTLNHHSEVPWLCAGDFNELIRQDEKLGEAIRSHGQCSYSRMYWMNVGLLILVLLAPDSHGASTFLMGTLFRKDLIEV